MPNESLDTNLKTFLRALYPSHAGVFPTEAAVRALVEYAGASVCDVERVVDPRLSHHSLRRMHAYAARLADERREPSETPPRMTVLLPSRECAPWGGGGSDDCRSPSPVRPRVPPRKICKQFRETGKCTFGSRCLYHHAAPQQQQQQPERSNTLCARPLGIMDRCVADMGSLHIDSPAKAHRTVLGTLPSATNNYCSPAKTKANVAYLQALPGSVLMLPLALPNGELYGYAPVPVQLAQPSQLTQLNPSN